MCIKDFVKTILLNISNAIDESNDEFGGARKFALSNSSDGSKYPGAFGMVELDLAVQVQQTDRRKKDGGFKVAVVNANAGAEKESTNSLTSRTKFSVMDNH